MKEIWYSIYSIDPSPNGDVYRLIEGYDKKEDAEKLLKTLEDLNWMHNTYKMLAEDFSTNLNKYQFNELDHIDRLKNVMEYDNLNICVKRFENNPIAIFGVDLNNTKKYEALCISSLEEESSYKLNKICSMLDDNDINYTVTTEDLV